MAKQTLRVGVPEPVRFNDFSGGRSSESPTLLALNEAQKADNLMLTLAGTLAPRKGRTKRYANAFASYAVKGLGALLKKDGSAYLLAEAGGKLYKDAQYSESKYDSQTEWETGTRTHIDTTTTPGDIKVASTPALTFTRASSAFDDSGNSYGNNTPRYGDAFNGSKGILMERAATNLLANPSFESGLASWTVTVTGAASITSELVEYEFGVKSAKVIMDGTSTCTLKQTVAATAGTSYNLGLSVKAPSITGTYWFKLTFKDAGSSVLSSTVVGGIGATTAPSGWVRTGNVVTSGGASITAPASTAWVELEFYVDAGGGTGTLYLDGIHLEAATNVSTTFIDSTRALETLTCPGTSLPKTGYIGFWLWPSPLTYTPAPSARDYVLLDAWDGAASLMKLEMASQQLKLTYKNSGGGTTVITSSSIVDSLVNRASSANKSAVLFFVGWNGTEVRAGIKYLNSSSGYTTREITSADLMNSSLGTTTLYIASDRTGAGQPNGLIDELKIGADDYGLSATFSALYDAYTATFAFSDLLIAKFESNLTLSLGAVWESPEITTEASAVGKLTATYSLSAGDRIFLTTSSYVSGAWTDWTEILADGTIASGSGTKVKARVSISGAASLSILSVLYDRSAAMVELTATGLAVYSDYDMKVFRDKIIITNPLNTPYKWDGSAVSATALGGSPPAMSFMAIHQNRAWGIEANSSRLRYSESLDPEDWPALNFIDFNPEDGHQATALLSTGGNLIVGKAKSMAVVTGDQVANFSVVWLDSHEEGPTGFRAIEPTDKFVAYVAQDGIRITDFTRSVLAMPKLKGAWDSEINKRKLSQAAMVVWKDLLLVALPGTGSDYNSTVWVLDTLHNSWSRITGWNVSCWLKYQSGGEDILLAGDSATGQVYRVWYGETDDGTVIKLDWQTGEEDFGYSDRYKLIGNHSVTVEGKATQQSLQIYYVAAGTLNANGDPVDTDVTYTPTEITVPAGEGVTRVYRTLPPSLDLILCRTVSVRIVTGARLVDMSLDVTVKGRVVGGLS